MFPRPIQQASNSRQWLYTIAVPAALFLWLLPLLGVALTSVRPATFIAVVVTVIGALRSFDLVSVMTDGGPYGSSRVLWFYMYEKALSEYGFRMGYGVAIAVVLFAIMMVLISGFIWKMWRDETER